MVRGKIWGEFNGRYHEIEIEECDVIAVIELKNKGDMIGSQVSSLGGGLATEDCALSVADGVVRVIQAVEISPEEKKVLLRLLADGINCLTKESSPSVDEILEMNIPGYMPLWMECWWIQRAGTGAGDQDRGDPAGEPADQVGRPDPGQLLLPGASLSGGDRV